MEVTLPEIEYVDDLSRACTLLDPLRLTILAEARSPASASTIADRLGLPRQRVNYHVGKLARAGFLIRAGRLKKRNMVEQRYLATARAYVVDPALLSPLAPSVEAVADTGSVARLVALAAEVQHDLALVTTQGRAHGRRVAAMSVSTDLRFRDARQRADFSTALSEAITGVIAEHTEPADSAPSPAPGSRTFRLVVGCYPLLEASPPTR